MSPFCCASLLLVMSLVLATTGSMGEEEGVSDFYVRKMKTIFRCMDKDKNGKLDVKDYEALFEIIFKGQNRGGEQDKQAIKEKARELWDAFNYDMNKKGDPVAEEEFIESMAKHNSEPESLGDFMTMLKLYFDDLDSNADGVLEPEEQYLDSEALGLNPEEAIVSFKIYDINLDGIVSFGEYFSVTAEYATDEKDELKPSRLIYGPLVS